MSREKVLLDDLFDAFLQKDKLKKSLRQLTSSSWRGLFNRLYYVGMFFLSVSGFGLGAFYILISTMSGVTDIGNIAEIFVLNALTPLVALLLIFSFFVPKIIEGINEGEVRFIRDANDFSVPTPIILEKWNEDHISSFLNYLVGFAFFTIGIAYRELIYEISLSTISSTSPFFQLSLGVFMLLLDFGYFGMLLISFAHIYEGYYTVQHD
ncbi:hypothetical protein [Halomicrococcus sp. SG-WS-1]|uniref:hypothetical protein n=1 Tax=Halomicrococcus sp. SG-WS-1 TaxID=3439057 RepID=UPI003F799B5E